MYQYKGYTYTYILYGAEAGRVYKIEKNMWCSGEPMSIEDLSEEYQRLSDLGYRLYYVEDHWTYYGNNQKEYIPVVVGLFTDEELSNFKASEQYGYVFDFVVNGDSSPISVDEENVVTNWNYDLY